MAIRQTLDGQLAVDSTVSVSRRARMMVDRRAVKVTIRLAAEAATTLAERARAAEVSQEPTSLACSTDRLRR
jgi:hypothetical protein